MMRLGPPRVDYVSRPVGPRPALPPDLDDVQISDAELAEFDKQCLGWGWEGMRRVEKSLRPGLRAVWIYPQPAWDCLYWIQYLSQTALEIQFSECPRSFAANLRLRTVMPDVHATAHIKSSTSQNEWYDDAIFYMQTLDLHTVTIDCRGRHWTANIVETGCEMGNAALVVSDDFPLDGAQAAAAALAIELDGWPAPLYRALASDERCMVCRRPLGDPVSLALGIGPDCAGRLGLEHSASLVEKVRR